MLKTFRISGTRGTQLLAAFLLCLATVRVSAFATAWGQGGEGTASIEGLVLSESTGRPISRAQVRLVSYASPTSGPVLLTGNDGKFRIAQVPSGRYALAVHHDGYLDRAYGQRDVGSLISGELAFTLRAGDVMKEVSIRLLESASIEGTLLDSDGSPQAKVPVSVVKWGHDEFGATILITAASGQTDDRGRYRLAGIAPGTFLVEAGLPLPSLSTGISPELDFLPVYYPGVADPSQGAAITIQAGQSVSGINFTAARRSRRRLSGKVIVAATGKPPEGATLVLTRVRNDHAASRTSNPLPRDGRFEIQNVPPGAYILSAEVAGPSSARTSLPPVVPSLGLSIGHAVFRATRLVTAMGALPVTVGERDIDDLVIEIKPPVALPGHVQVSLAPQETARLVNTKIQAMPTEGGGRLFESRQTPDAASIDTQGSFHIDGVFDGEYRFGLSSLPDGYYVQQLRVNGADAFGKPVNISGPATLDIAVGDDGGSLVGVLHDERGASVAGVPVFLIPDQDKDRPERFKGVRTDEQGHFEFHGIAPGSYHVFSWAFLSTSLEFFDPEFVARFRNKGTAVRVEPRSNNTIDVTLIESTK